MLRLRINGIVQWCPVLIAIPSWSKNVPISCGCISSEWKDNIPPRINGSNGPNNVSLSSDLNLDKAYSVNSILWNA